MNFGLPTKMLFAITTVFSISSLALREWYAKSKKPLNEQTTWLRNEWEQGFKESRENLEI